MTIEQLFQPIRYVTLKLTNGCNLSCDYCNVEAVTPRTPKMSMERFRRVATLLIENSRSAHVGLEFHGGEPLLLDDQWFEEAVGFARDLAAKHKKFIDFPLVTNATMLTEERLAKLVELDIKLCVSCDGPPHINDKFRGGGKAVERALRLMVQNKVGFGLILVMSQSNYSHMTEVMDWFADVGVPEFQINHVQPQGRGLDAELMTGEQMFEGMRLVTEHMAANNVIVEEAETLTHIRRFAEGRPPASGLSCWEYQCQAGRTYIALDHSGTIHLCGTDLMNHQIGHLDHDFDERRYQRKLARLHRKDAWEMRCFDCAAKQICNHSCPTSDFNSDSFREESCKMTKLLWNYFCQNPHIPRAIAETVRWRHPEDFVPSSEVQIYNREAARV